MTMNSPDRSHEQILFSFLFFQGYSSPLHGLYCIPLGLVLAQKHITLMTPLVTFYEQLRLLQNILNIAVFVVKLHGLAKKKDNRR